MKRGTGLLSILTAIAFQLSPLLFAQEKIDRDKINSSFDGGNGAGRGERVNPGTGTGLEALGNIAKEIIDSNDLQKK